MCVKKKQLFKRFGFLHGRWIFTDKIKFWSKIIILFIRTHNRTIVNNKKKHKIYKFIYKARAYCRRRGPRSREETKHVRVSCEISFRFPVRVSAAVYDLCAKYIFDPRTLCVGNIGDDYRCYYNIIIINGFYLSHGYRGDDDDDDDVRDIMYNMMYDA